MQRTLFRTALNAAVLTFTLVSSSCSSTNTGASTTTTTAASSGGTTTSTSAADAAAPSSDASASTAPAISLPAMPTNLPSPPRPWEQLSAEERGHYMGEHVIPAMRALFSAYDPSHAQVTCGTCHGRNAREVNFRMPNGLPTLPAFGSPEARAWHERDPRMFAFMGERVVPAMAQLLGRQPYNPQTHQGFGCRACHPSAAQ